MSCLHYQGNELFIESVGLKSIAEQFGTPVYVYSRAAIENRWRAFNQAFQGIPHRICYAVKANSNIAILQVLSMLGSGFDIVSAGELERVMAAGGHPEKIVFSGVGKTEQEIKRAIDCSVFCFDVESAQELDRLNAIAASCNKKINIALRVNPDVDAQTHTHISTGLKENKFGVDLADVIPLCKKTSTLSSIKLIGLACHIGSQITELSPFLAAFDQLLVIYKQLQSMDIFLSHLNIGGGLGIRYQDETPPDIASYAAAIQKKLAGLPIELIIEPGRAIVGEAGVLLTRIEYLKHHTDKNFAIVDAGMNDLLRPALYDAWQPILPVYKRTTPSKRYDIAGPVCESADILGKERDLAVAPGDLLAIDNAGAYGFSMSSTYNSRNRPAEVLVAGERIHLIRRRETLADALALENLLTE